MQCGLGTLVGGCCYIVLSLFGRVCLLVQYRYPPFEADHLSRNIVIARVGHRFDTNNSDSNSVSY